MSAPYTSTPERFLTVRRFATLSEPADNNFRVDLGRNNFFNPSRANTERLRKEVGAEAVLSAKTPPEVVAREVFRSLGIIPDENTQLYLNQQAHALTAAAKRGEQRAVQQLVATNVPRNALVRRGFDDLQNYLDESFGIMYDHLGLQASTFGSFVVAQAVMDVETNRDFIIDLHDPSSSNTVL